jgi:hypothetical protein
MMNKSIAGQIWMISGWWLTPLKNDGVKVSWDDDIPNMMGKIENDPNHQPASV